MAEQRPFSDRECDSALSRRDFVKALGTAALATSVPLIGSRTALTASATRAGSGATSRAESAVGRFF